MQRCRLWNENEDFESLHGGCGCSPPNNVENGRGRSLLAIIGLRLCRGRSVKPPGVQVLNCHRSKKEINWNPSKGMWPKVTLGKRTWYAEQFYFQSHRCREGLLPQHVLFTLNRQIYSPLVFTLLPSKAKFIHEHFRFIEKVYDPVHSNLSIEFFNRIPF